MTGWEPLAKHLVEAIDATGELEPQWRRAFEQTPRHIFAPRFWELGEYNVPSTLVDGADSDQRQEWLDACYTNRVLITRWVGDMSGRRTISSSASLPSLVAHMLRIMEVADGQRVLEIGTGTGWNAALLCHRLGHERVSTVDVDAVIAAEAEHHLHQLGYRPTVKAVDGIAGLPDAAPYDRILGTCSTGHIPSAWIEQLADGGLIVAPCTYGGALAVLRKTAPGVVAGRLDSEQVYFMPLHAPGESYPQGFLVDKPQPGDTAPAYRGTTDIPLTAWADPDWRLWLALHLPEGHLADLVDVIDNQYRRTGTVVYTAAARATVDYASGGEGPWPITQDESRLWNTVEAAWNSWRHNGEPDRTRIGITAHVNGEQWAWLDHADGPVRWPLPN